MQASHALEPTGERRRSGMEQCAEAARDAVSHHRPLIGRARCSRRLRNSASRTSNVSRPFAGLSRGTISLKHGEP